MRHPLLLAAAIATLWFAACTKKDVPYGFQVSEYTMLTPGNYWIYLSYVVDSNDRGYPGTYAGSGIYLDSVYVEKDTTIGSHSYHKVMSPNVPGSRVYIPDFLRDSANYLVTNYGAVLFSPLNTNTSFYSKTVSPSGFSADSAYHEELITGDVNKQFAIPAGTFNTIATITRWTFYPYAASGNPVYHRRQYSRFAAGIGMVSQALSFNPAYPPPSSAGL